MNYMTPEDWAMHNDAINGWHEDAFQEEIIWRRAATTRDYHGEDTNLRPEPIVLKGLVMYNFFRTWPIDQATDTGEIDKQSCLLILNIKWLNDNGYLNQQHQLDYDQGHDKFEINGLSHVPSGDSQIAQAYDNPLLFFVILKREEISTGSSRY